MLLIQLSLLFLQISFISLKQITPSDLIASYFRHISSYYLILTLYCYCNLIFKTLHFINDLFTEYYHYYYFF